MTSDQASETGGPQDLTARLAQYVDIPFYLAQLDAARACGVDVGLTEGQDVCDHFLTRGWRLGLSPNRWFDTLGYLAANPGTVGVNPFLHYLEMGLDAGRRPMPFFQDRSWKNPDLDRFGRCEYGPVRHVLRLDGPVTEARWPERMAVHLHLFYPEMTPRIITLLGRLPCDFDLLVSVPEGTDRTGVRQRLTQALPRARRVILRSGPNRGRDMAPWLVSFAEEIRQSDLFLHLHSKKSAHGSYHEGWFDFLGHSLLGSPAVAAQMLGLFAGDPGLGMVAPGYWPLLRRAPNYGQTRDLCDHLGARMGLGALPEICPDFPAGSFFCCRSRLLTPLLDLQLTYRDFPAEAGQICGTPAHAVERLLGILPGQAGLRFEMLAVDVPFEQAAQQPRRIPPVKGPGRKLPPVSVICLVTQGGKAAAPALAEALASALGQTPAPQELLLVDASGQDAALSEIIARFGDAIAAGRLRLLAMQGRDPGQAYNAALDEARGEIIAYLDADVLWAPGYLRQVAAAFAAHPEEVSLYSDLVGADGRLQAPDYARAKLVAQPGLDLAVFVHRRALVDAGLRFAPGLEPEQAAAWDFILQATASRAPLHLDHVGCARTSGSGAQEALPAQARRAVQIRHRNECLYWQQDRFQIALKVPAPRPEFKHRWGDLHLANSLARALQRLGCRTRVDILPDWYDHHPEDDATLVFRGVTPYAPDPRHINMMWHISHPARVSLEEMRGYDHIFVSAYPEAEQVIAALGMQASAMLQCADPELFHPEVDLAGVPRHDLLFVGNSRKTARWMPQACVDRGLPVAIYGAEWDGLVPPQYLHGTHVPNDRLAAYYRASRIVLNDHWPDMAARGFVSNRIMDAGLAGALVISDHFSGEEIFMGHVVTCRSAAEVEEAVRHYLADEPARQAKAAELRRLVLLHHRVEQRAAQVMQTLRALARDRLHRLR